MRRGCVGVLVALAVGVRAGGCEHTTGLLLPARESDTLDLPAPVLVARLVHVSDLHLMDTLSPARFAQAHAFSATAWRPYEAYSTQLADGILRATNRIHAAGRTIDFVMLTGDVCDNAQANELAWLRALFDGGVVNPLSGPDDRAPADRPAVELDPYAAFEAQGLYRAGVHGALPSIPWYTLLGNHDALALGVFPFFEAAAGHRTAPLPLEWRPGIVLPVLLDPTGAWAYGNVTPAEPGPPGWFEVAQPVVPDPARAYFSKPEFVQALFTTATEPAGHGFAGVDAGATWYSVSPVAGLRLIGLDTTDAVRKLPGHMYDNGALSRAQFAFLQAELAAAIRRGELVIVATHHPSDTLTTLAGTEVGADEFRAALQACPAVVLHLTGHMHRNRVVDRVTYVEIETCATLDPPQEARLVELWRDTTGGQIAVVYEMFSHIQDELPPLGDDPLRALRAQAQALARGDKLAAARQQQHDPSGADPRGTLVDRAGVLILPR